MRHLMIMIGLAASRWRRQSAKMYRIDKFEIPQTF